VIAPTKYHEKSNFSVLQQVNCLDIFSRPAHRFFNWGSEKKSKAHFCGFQLATDGLAKATKVASRWQCVKI
jgi:hypothetical protein